MAASAAFAGAPLLKPALLSHSGAGSALKFRADPLSVACAPRRRNPRRGGDGRGFVVRASTAIVGPIPVPDMRDAGPNSAPAELLACPVCFEPLVRTGEPGLTQRAITRSGFQCPTCKKAYSSRNTYLDLTVTADAKVYSEGVAAAGAQLFRSPLVSFAYERGWRQNFGRAGFPGPDEEVRMAKKFLRPAFGGVLLDVSCGSGLFTRRFAGLDLFSAVVAVDYSESMLRQTMEYIRRDDALLGKAIALVRADVARMPFASGSVDAVFAGAALHCWPSPAGGMAEIVRILRPGGVFVGTTFLSPTPLGSVGRVLDELRPPPPRSASTTLRYWQEAELRDLVRVCGLVDYQSVVKRGFIMLSARKSNARDL